MADMNAINLDDLMAGKKTVVPKEEPKKKEEKEVKKSTPKPRAKRVSKNENRVHRTFMAPEDYDIKIALIQDYLTDKIANNTFHFKKNDAINYILEDTYKKAKKHFNIDED